MFSCASEAETYLGVLDAVFMVSYAVVWFSLLYLIVKKHKTVLIVLHVYTCNVMGN